MKELFDVPSDVKAQDGAVLVDGPDGLSYAMTPEAATRTSARLLHSAAKAQGQQASISKKDPASVH